MASEVSICNLALAHLGDAATVSSIAPPDGSVQADLCAQFYPAARDALLEMHDWGFATRRAALAELVNASPTTAWAYCYAQPVDLVNTISVVAPDAQDDTSGYANAEAVLLQPWGEPQVVGTGSYTPQPFVLESTPDGADVIYTNQANAVLRYVARVSDPTKFSPLFVVTLAHSLAAMLAGPLVKGREGAAMMQQQHALAFGRDGRGGWFGRAVESDANQRRSTARDRQQVAWMRAR
jgi:hypothetical protein